jgi:hypothetical protein
VLLLSLDAPFVYIVNLKDFMESHPAQVSDPAPAQDVAPFTFYRDRIYISGELWGYWQQAFLGGSASDMFEHVKYDIDNEHAEFTHSLARWGLHPLPRYFYLV